MPPDYTPTDPAQAAAFAAALRKLTHHAMRITTPRRAMLAFLLRKPGPFSADELHTRLASDECDSVTVYRSLQAMEAIGALRRHEFGDGINRYEFNHGENHTHYLICRQCHASRPLDFCGAEGVERMARRIGYAEVSHSLTVFGVCEACQSKP